MSGRIWVVEFKPNGSRNVPWSVWSGAYPNRTVARWAQQDIRRNAFDHTRVVQYVRQGGAR